MVTRYSTPSGQAAAMSTSEPNSTATPNTEIKRPNQSGPCPGSVADNWATCVVSSVVASVLSSVVPVAGTEESVPSVGAVVATAASLCTVKVMLPWPFGLPSSSLTSQLARHAPLGRSSITSAVIVRRSSLTSRGPTV